MSRIAEEGNTFFQPMCNRCARYFGKARCEAFPERIPDEILEGFDHREPYPGDGGLRFRPEVKTLNSV